jgi:hypothetical protein
MRIPVRTAMRTRVRPGSSKALKRRDTSSVVKNRNCPRSGLGGSLTPVAGFNGTYSQCTAVLKIVNNHSLLGSREPTLL